MILCEEPSGGIENFSSSDKERIHISVLFFQVLQIWILFFSDLIL